VAIDGSTAVVGASQTNSGAAYIYVKGKSGWPASPTVTLLDPGAGSDNFGNSVAIRGNTIIIGAQYTNSAGGAGAAGAAYIYVKGESGWPTKPTVALADPAAAGGDFFGSSVAVDATTIAVGSVGVNGYAGATYIYTTKGEEQGWRTTPTATLADPAAISGDSFGNSVAVGTNVVLVGAAGVNGTAGAAYVYTKGQHGSWPTAPTTTLADPAATGGDTFGYSVALDGDTLVVGANGTNATGAAYIYTKSLNNWPATPTTSLADPPATTNDDFGVSVAVDGSRLAVGSDGPPAFGFDQFEGAAYYYTKGLTGWATTPSTTVADPGATPGDYFGTSVAVETNVAIVGARGCPVGCFFNTHGGAAYIFTA
jgi:hypothetical protein